MRRSTRLTVLSCKVSTIPFYIYARLYSVVTQRILESMCLLCVFMMQATLFGKLKWKESFFTNVSANTASAYYTTIEFLRKLLSVTDRKHFLKAAQQQWTQIYQDNHDLRETVLAQTKTCKLETITHTIPAFVKTISRERALHGWEEECLAKKTEPEMSSSSSDSCKTLLHAILDGRVGHFQ